MFKALLSILTFLLCIYSKTITRHFQPIFVEKNGFAFLTKFHMDQGFGLIHLRNWIHSSKTIDLKTTTFINLEIIKVEDWPNFTKDSVCKNLHDVFSIHHEEIQINKDDEDPGEKQFFLKQETPQLYYFIVADCDNNWNLYAGDEKFVSFLTIEISIKNTNDSHFSLEDQQLIKPCAITMFLILVFICFNLKKMFELYKKQALIDYPLILTAIALIFEFLSLGLQLLNLLNYQSDGHYNFMLSFSQLFCESAANFLFTLIFIFVAWGWSINYMNLTNFDYFMPTIAVLGSTNVILVILNKIIFNNDEKPSNTGLSFLSYIYFVYKMGFFAYFIKGILKTYGLARTKIRGFVMKFIILGVLFFISYGILLMIASFLESYEQKRFLLIGNEIINMLITISLLRIFNSKLYNDFSFKGRDVLPQENLPKLN